MTNIDTLGGTVHGGTLYGIGVGPGDVRYLTLRAAALVGAVDVVAFFAKQGGPGNARRIVDPLMAPGRVEMRLEYPVTNEIPAESAAYQCQISAFYEKSSKELAGLLREGNRSACCPRAIRFSTAPSCICGAGSRPTFRSRSCPA